MKDTTHRAGSWQRILSTLILAVLLEQLPWANGARALLPDFVLVGVLFWVLLGTVSGVNDRFDGLG